MSSGYGLLLCSIALAPLAVFARDHAQGNEQLVAMVPGLTVCGGDHRIGALNKKVKHHDELSVSEGMCVCGSFLARFT